MSALTSQPERIVSELLIKQSLATSPADNGSWPAYYQIEPDKPDDVITTFRTEGILRGSLNPTGEQVEAFGIQIRVRSQTPETGWTKINAIVDDLDTNVRLTLVAVSGTTYTVHSMDRIGSIISLGKERETNRHIHVVNYTATLSQ